MNFAVYAHNSRMTMRVHHQERRSDLERLIADLQNLDRDELFRLRDEVGLRLREIGDDKPVSGVLEYRPHADGTLQKEVRRYYRKDGSVKEQGPYWYFRYHEDGKQKKLYLGKTDDPEGELERKRATSPAAQTA